MKMPNILVHLFKRAKPLCFARLFLFVAICSALSIAGCNRPSYPKEKLEKAVEELVFKEYGYSIEARVLGKTLGLFFPVTQIFNADLSDEVESFGKKRQDIFLSAVRVCMSTDADLDFFLTKYTDSFKGLEVTIIRSVEDTKRFLLGNISRNDYAERTVTTYSYDVENIAKKTIRQFFKNIPDKKSQSSSYFLPGKQYNESFFFKYLMESELKDNIYYSIIKIKTKRLQKDQVLIYAKVRETYTPKPGYESYEFLFPSPTVHEFMFEMTIIRQIIPIITNSYTFKDKLNGQVITPRKPDIFAKHANIEQWDDYFYFEDVRLPDFIIKQLAQRVNRKLTLALHPEKATSDEFDMLKEPQNVSMIEGKFEENQNNNDKIFHLIFRFHENTSPVISSELSELILKFFVRTLKKYRYYDYTKLIFLDSAGKELNSFDKTNIDELQLDRFSWKSLFKLRPNQY